jgi:chromosome partitioning protein
MAVITFANTKGGAGKTTAVLLLATELARKGYRITILDADPQHWISRWHEVSGHVANISVIDFVTSASLPHHISDNKHNTDYFIIDLPGARNPMLATAIGLSDHVLIPIQGCAMDARGGAQVLELLQYLDEKAGIKIGHSVVLTRVNSMVTTRALALVKSLLSERQVPVLDTAIIERSAFPRYLRLRRHAAHARSGPRQQPREGARERTLFCRRDHAQAAGQASGRSPHDRSADPLGGVEPIESNEECAPVRWGAFFFASGQSSYLAWPCDALPLAGNKSFVAAATVTCCIHRIRRRSSMSIFRRGASPERGNSMHLKKLYTGILRCAGDYRGDE